MDHEMNHIIASKIAMDHKNASYDSPWRQDDKWTIFTYEMAGGGETTLVQCPDCYGKEAPVEAADPNAVKEERMDVPWPSYDVCDHCGRSYDEVKSDDAKKASKNAVERRTSSDKPWRTYTDQGDSIILVMPDGSEHYTGFTREGGMDREELEERCWEIYQREIAE